MAFASMSTRPMEQGRTTNTEKVGDGLERPAGKRRMEDGDLKCSACTCPPPIVLLGLPALLSFFCGLAWRRDSATEDYCRCRGLGPRMASEDDRG